MSVIACKTTIIFSEFGVDVAYLSEQQQIKFRLDSTSERLIRSIIRGEDTVVWRSWIEPYMSISGGEVKMSFTDYEQRFELNISGLLHGFDGPAVENYTVDEDKTGEMIITSTEHYIFGREEE